MKNDSIEPLYLVMLGIFVLVLSGFLTATYVGMAERKGNKLKAGFNFRSGSQAAVAETGSFVASLKKGGEAIVSGFMNAVDSFLPGLDNKPASGSATASARGGSGGWEASGERDRFEDFYDKNDSAGSDGSSAFGSGSGFSGSRSGSDGNSSSTSGWRKPPSEAESAPSLSEAAAAARKYSVPHGASAAAGNPLFGGPLAKAGNRAASLQASLPSGTFPSYMAGPRGSLPASEAMSSARGGTLSGMKGSSNSGDLNGASENARSGSEGSYNSKMSVGASAIAGGAGGKAAPAASKAENTSGSAGGSSSGGSSAGSSSAGGASSKSSGGGNKAAAPTAKDAPKTDKSADNPAGTSSDNFFAAPAPSLLESVVSEQHNGQSEKYITDEDRKNEIDETLLKGEDAPAPARNKQFSPEPPAAVTKDPKDLSQLSPERKTELKQKVHGFLERFGNRFGPISKENTTYTSCGRDPIFCEDNKVANGYIKTATDELVTLWMGLRYSERRSEWHPYAIKTNPADLAGSHPARGHSGHALRNQGTPAAE